MAGQTTLLAVIRSCLYQREVGHPKERGECSLRISLASGQCTGGHSGARKDELTLATGG